MERFKNIESECGDDFSGVHEDVILRVEVTAGDLHHLRYAIAEFKKSLGLTRS